MASWHRVGPYESVALREAKAESARKKLQKKYPNIRPVILKGRVIAHGWWGQAWCQNLERYADFMPHIEQGRSYVRYGAVLDLQIARGLITAVVQGSRERPYKIQIHVDRMAPADWRLLRQGCRGRLDSLESLLAGELPKPLTDLFQRQGQGLFPLADEIHFECTCPEGEGLCKHLLAVLYGVGARLDESPELLFLLRQVDPLELVQSAADAPEQAPGEAVAETAPAFRAGAARRRRPVKAAGTSEAAPLRRRRIVVPPAPQPAAAVEATQAKKRRPAAETPKGPPSPTEKVVALIQRSAQGIDTATLQRRTGLSVAVIRAAVYTALRKGLIRRVGWGLYKGA